MGGGDLNSKKSWHPNTMKNQERVWKAEQAAAEEKNRIMELQRERAEERDRAELNEMAKRNAGTSSGSENRLNWMYDKPDKKAQHEDYLLGKAIEKNYDQPEKSDDIIPAVARRVVGSSMLASTGDAQVDLQRKIREDPLLLVKERERAARAALLNNPVHRRRIAELLRKEQEKKNVSKEKKKSKKKDKDLDNALAAKLNALGADKGVDLAALLVSNSSSDSSSEEEQSKKKKKKKHKSKKSKKSKEKKNTAKETDLDSSEEDRKKTKRLKKKDRKEGSSKEKKKQNNSIESPTKLDSHQLYKVSKNRENNQRRDSRKRKSESYDSDKDVKSKKSKRDEVMDNIGSRHPYHDSSGVEKFKDRRRGGSPEHYKRKTESVEWSKQKKSAGLSEEDRAARLAAMAAAGAEREVQRGRRVAEQRAVDAAESAAPRHRFSARSDAHALPESLESRIHSNRHYIQRDQRHMNEHFARR